MRNRFVVITAIVSFLTLSISNSVIANKYNITLAELASCKEYRLYSGYSYKDYFLIEDLKNERKMDEILRLKFYVMTEMDAHILLSETDHPQKDTSVYEIVIGAGNNRFSTLRKQIGKSRLALTTKANVLSSLDPTPIIVIQHVDGKLEISIPGSEPDPHLFYQDSSPLAIKYVSLSTFHNTPARWFYDCQNDAENTDLIFQESRNLSGLERLQTFLADGYDPFVVPPNLTEMTISFSLKRVRYDRKRASLITNAEFSLKWIDARLKWEKNDYEGLSGFIAPNFHYWSPSLMILNSAGDSYPHLPLDYIGSISHEGLVTIQSSETSIESWCLEGISDWPDDILDCMLQVQLYEKGINLTYVETNIKKYYKELSEWNLKNFEIANVNHIEAVVPETAVSDFTVKLQLLRNQKFYRKIFYPPLGVSCSLVLIALHLQGCGRLITNFSALFVILITLMCLGMHSPSEYVPKIVKLYGASALISCYTLCLHVLNRCFREDPPDFKPPSCLNRFIEFEPIRFILGMRYSDAFEYLEIRKHPWAELTKMIDRFTFIILFVLYTYFIIFLS